ncbi:MAG: hypothetical protein AUG16_02085 [Thaumarchaeota archaeon 13_1_20CM_2_39_20]|nr:MAG: hypothetical protein AUI59_02790 [Thaumarchaeota archaeon 13_1_40CM_2_39_13_1]OLE40894.1 MAG: hypothetical protein AUG16_02085 [Thaumarchaeota archaeon 13_1_20CM_2_39_20]
MKKKTKKILLISMAAFFAIIMVASSTVALIGFGGNKGTSDQSKPGLTITGTPADNYPDNKRTTFCESAGAKSSRYITEFKIPTACAQPLGITTDSSGIVWFTESNTGNIAKFDPSTKNFEEFNNPQWQKGEKSMMWGINFASDGNLWYSDSQHGLIWKFNPQQKNYANFVFPKTAGQEVFPQMLETDGNKILVNDFTGRKIAVFGTEQTGPSLQATEIPSPGNYNFTSTMAVDAGGKIWYTVWIYQQGGILVSYDPKTGNSAQFSLPSGVEAPNGISFDSNGKLWITDTASSFFLSFDPQSKQFSKFVTSPPPVLSYGNASGLIKTPISRPYWNYFDDKGRLWFNEQVANSIGVFDPVKESLVEYLVPSKNPNWSDCGTSQDCGVAQVLDFTVDHDKVWFTEWVEDNIGLLDSSSTLPLDVNLSSSSITLHRGQNATISLTLTPNEQLSSPVDILTSYTAGPHNISVAASDQNIILDKSKSLSINIGADNFALSDTYKVLVGARYQDVTISKFVAVTIE